MAKYFDRVGQVTATTGTGTITLGAVITDATNGDCMTFSDVGAVAGDTPYYLIVDGNNVEYGIGTLGGTGPGFTMTRTVTKSKIAGTAGATALTLSGNAKVYCVLEAAQAASFGTGGSTGQVQYNNASSFGGISGSAVTSNGSVTFGGATITVNDPVITISQTWNGPTVATTAASGTGATATITFAAQPSAYPIGSTVVVAGVTPTGYNGTFVVTASSTTSVSYASATTGAQTVAGTVQQAFTGLLSKVTNTASASISKLIDLQVGGVSKFNVDSTGIVNIGTSGSISAGGTFTGSNFKGVANNSQITLGLNSDVLLTRRAAAGLQLGNADAAAPVAQTVTPQSVVAGTTNTAGATFTIQ